MSSVTDSEPIISLAPVNTAGLSRPVVQHIPDTSYLFSSLCVVPAPISGRNEKEKVDGGGPDLGEETDNALHTCIGTP